MDPYTPKPGEEVPRDPITERIQEKMRYEDRSVNYCFAAAFIFLAALTALGVVGYSFPWKQPYVAVPAGALVALCIGFCLWRAWRFHRMAAQVVVPPRT